MPFLHGHDALLDKLRQRRRSHDLWFWQQQGNGFTLIANSLVAFIQQPAWIASRFRRPLAKQGTVHYPWQPPTGEEVDRPDGILCRRFPKVTHQSSDLLVGASGAVQVVVEFGEAEHG